MPRNFSAISSSLASFGPLSLFLAAWPEKVLGERLGEPVGKRLRHDRPVVVVLALEPGGEPSAPMPAVTANAPT